MGKHVLHAEAGMSMSTGLSRVAERAQSKGRVRFTALVHHIGPELLRETWRLLNRRGAPGVDGETAQAFERALDQRVGDMVERLKAGSYQAPPVRRVEIPKGDGRTRKLGIPTMEDRLLESGSTHIGGHLRSGIPGGILRIQAWT